MSTDNGDNDELAQGEESQEKNGSNAAKITVSVFLIVCISVAGFLYLLFAFRKFCRPRKDLRSFLGVALARIHNVDAETPEQRVRMGVGCD